MLDAKHLLELPEIEETERTPQRVAVIDMGSNSFRLVVFEYVPGVSFKEVDEVRESPRLSEGMAEMLVMRPAAIDRDVRAAQIYFRGDEQALGIPLEIVAVPEE
ncbi:MAG: hypothetical protein IH587_05680 [Anaerolineae bacterium]|nr:hypothetical protein [Anaerolineae bacterium]